MAAVGGGGVAEDHLTCHFGDASGGSLAGGGEGRREREIPEREKERRELRL